MLGCWFQQCVINCIEMCMEVLDTMKVESWHRLQWASVVVKLLSLGHCPSHRSCLQSISRVSPFASPVIYAADFIFSPQSIFEADTSSFVLFLQSTVGTGIPSAWLINHTPSSSLLSHASPSHPIHIPYPRPFHHQPLHPEQSKLSSSPAISHPH